MLQKSEQIVTSGSDVILMMDQSKDIGTYSPYLIFYRQREVYADCYFDSEKIDTIEAGAYTL